MPKAAAKRSWAKSPSSKPYAKTSSSPAAKQTPLKEKSANEQSKRISSTKSDTSSQTPKEPTKASKSTVDTNKSKSADAAPDAGIDKQCNFLDVKLEGEDRNAVKVYDNCAEVRRKMADLLGKNRDKPGNGMPGETDAKGKPKPWTKAKLAAACGTNPRVLGAFMDLKGKSRGAESEAYYGGYVFFEKKRVHEGTAKSKKRLDVEMKFPDGIPFDDLDKMCKLKNRPIFMLMGAAGARAQFKELGKGVLL